MLMRPSKAERTVRMRKVLARPWVGVQVCHLLLMFFFKYLQFFSIFYSSQTFPIKVYRSHRSTNRGWDFARSRYGVDSAYVGRQTKTLHSLQIDTRSRQKTGNESGRDERSADSVKKLGKQFLAQQLNLFYNFRNLIRLYVLSGK